MAYASPSARSQFDDVAAMFWHAVDCAPETIALIDEQRSLNYEQFGASAAALARHLLTFFDGNERVAIHLPNSIEANVAFLACLVAGAQAVMINPLYTEHELVRMLNVATPKVILTLAGSEGPAMEAAAQAGVDHVLVLGEGDLMLSALLADPGPRPDVVITPDTLANMVFTGGTTGEPKGVSRSHRSLMKVTENMQAAWPARLGEEVWLNVAPIAHVWGVHMGCLNPIYSHSPLVIVRRYKPADVLAAVEQHRVTMFSGGPSAIYVGLLASPALENTELGSIRVCPGGGSVFLMETLQAWESKVGLPILEAFGMTEGGPLTANPMDGTHRYGTAGRPLPGVELQIVDIDDFERQLPVGTAGEIRVRGETVVHRYWGHPDGHPDGWLATGDVGFVDEDGFLHIVDRKKDMIIVGGYNVYPSEIEEVLASQPTVAEAYVVGIPDERKGEVPVAFVILREDASATPEELASACETKLVAYKQPRAIHLVNSIPRTPANKVDKKALAQIARHNKLEHPTY